MRLVLRATLSGMLSLIFMALPGAASAQEKGEAARKDAAGQSDDAAAPDKILFDRATRSIQRGRHEIARLTLQTLINTYPDSEYLAKAKLAIADSFFKEAGSANLTQAAASYKDFIVFFPFLQEAAYAQMQVGMTHYRQLEKPDRDRTHAKAAEAEFQEFLRKYPDDPLAPQAEQRLREVQEVLAEGDFRIGYFYYLKGNYTYRAAAARLITLTNRYPLYSRSDRALWMLGTIFEQSERKDIAAAHYARIVRNYPLSPMTADAKKKLVALGTPVPQPDPVALARMQQDQAIERKRPGLFHKATGILRSGPDVQMAARIGKPNLEPESVSPGTDILTPGGTNSLGGGATTAVVATVTPGPTASANSAPTSAAAPATADAPPVPTNEPPANDPAREQPAAASATPSAAGTPDGSGPAESAAPADNAVVPAANSPAQASAQSEEKSGEKKKKKESSSKKKKGLRKIIPF